MGAACSKPNTDDGDDLLIDPHEADGQQRVKKHLQKAQAEKLIVIPEAEVVIIGGSGGEAPVQVGSFALLKLETSRRLAVLYVGEALDDLANGWCYPLLPETPVLLSGARVLTVHAGEGDVFGVRLPKELPGGESQWLELVELLSKECELQIQQEPDLADKVAGLFLAGSQKLIGGVEVVTNFATKGIRKGGELARSRLGQREEVQVSENTKAGVATARFFSGGAVVVASTVVDGLMETAQILGQEASKLAGAGKEDNGGKESAALRVGKAAGVAGLQVFDSLMKAGDTLVQETCDETSATVGHCYGKDAGEVTRDGMGVAIDAKQFYDMMGKKAVTRLAAKASLYTAKGMMEGPSTNVNRSNNGNAVAAAATKPAN